MSLLRSEGSHDFQIGRLATRQWPKKHKGELENSSRQPRVLLKNRHCDSLQKSQLAHFLGMLKKGNVADDDDLRTTVQSQNHATAT